jgi:dTDP-4-amino-4,6-dideoxygalactose transaminase/LmbE family N-acetylglucosaminyl deacetylase
MKNTNGSKQVLVIAAHPDDEVLGVGGTIAQHVRQGDRVCVLIMTDGVTSRHNVVEPQKMAARECARLLGVQDLRLADLPDQKLDGMPLLEIIRPISKVISELSPEIVYTHHSGDANQDHRTIFSATLVAVRPFGDNPVERVLCYEVASSTEWGPPFADWVFLPNVYMDISETLDTKLRAFEAYRETFFSEVRPFPHPRSCQALRIYAQHRGVSAGMQAAEAFVLVRELGRRKETGTTADRTRNQDSVFLPYTLPDIDETDARAVADVVRSRWLTTGAQAHQFETEFSAYVGAEHAVAVNSCTAALHLALEAIGLEAGDEVITSPYTFAATAEVIRYFDAHPVFVDVDPGDLNIRADAAEQAVTPRTKAIIPVHMAGLPADLDGIYEVAQRHNLHVIEDAAHAFPAKYRGQMIGSLSDFTCFSYYATKTITTGEGGMICTNNKAWADRCRTMALHGITRDAWKRYTAEGSWHYEIDAPGYKYNLSDIAAGLGLAQLHKADRMWARRRMIAHQYNRAFAELPELQTPADRPDCQHAWHLYMLRLNLEQLEIDRRQFILALKELGIGTSVHFIPLHMQPYYRQKYAYRPEDYPVAYQEYLREVSLPIYSGMTDADVARVIGAVKELVSEHRAKKLAAACEEEITLTG